MNSKGFNECETKTCETKFKNLIRSYMTCPDHNKKSGNHPMRKCANFDEMHDIFHDDDTMRPVALFSSKKGNSSAVDVDSCESTSKAGTPDLLSDVNKGK
ncbi:unnamed protein product [Porites lobata]|uniref:Zinc finger protein n=1 Tax=Porites lobata TaxID=104759 RepID=A0ABN8QAN4_9CNID|nr:unnamed protein product [Porites lobata]